MKSVVILGAGLIGKTIAADLHKRYTVVCADISKAALEKVHAALPVEVVEVDFTDEKALHALIAPFDLVIGAVPGHLGFGVLKSVIKAKKNVVDISFFPENPFLLDELAKENNITALVDCGIAPGACNLFAGYHQAQQKILRYECMVGGLPVERILPFEYKAGFSPIDVIEEYTRPAQYVSEGRCVTTEALSEIENIFVSGVGHLEAFATDGLRTLINTLSGTAYMKEKTLRYPGHAALMKIFRETGLFGKEPVKVKDVSVVPLEFTGKLLFPKWEMKRGDEDFTYMRVNIEVADHVYEYQLLDRYDRATETTSMARTTGYTCAAIATLVLENKFSQKGISPPEYVGADASCFREVMHYLSDRNVNFNITSTYKPQPATITE